MQDGYICLTPQGGAQKGPAIFDSRGRLIWFQPSKGSDAANLQVTTYKGQPTLAWFEGDVNKAGYGQGTHFLYNDQYQQVARIQAERRRARRPARARDHAAGHRTNRRLYAEDRRPDAIRR